jgi:hypothetical protein
MRWCDVVDINTVASSILEHEPKTRMRRYCEVMHYLHILKLLRLHDAVISDLRAICHILVHLATFFDAPTP